MSGIPKQATETLLVQITMMVCLPCCHTRIGCLGDNGTLISNRLAEKTAKAVRVEKGERTAVSREESQHIEEGKEENDDAK